MRKLLVIMLNIVLLAGMLVGCGCTTNTVEAQRNLYWQRTNGKITEAEYEERIRQEREAQPWATEAEKPWGVGSHHDEPRPWY